MSPEILFGEIYGTRTDVWSLAVVSFEFANGGKSLFNHSRDIYNWVRQSDMFNLDLISKSVMGNLSNKLCHFMKIMLSCVEIERPDSMTVFETSIKNQLLSPTPYCSGFGSFSNYIFIN